MLSVHVAVLNQTNISDLINLDYLEGTRCSFLQLQVQVSMIFLDIYAHPAVGLLRIVPELQFKYTQASGGTPDGGSRRSRPVS